ncbi:four-helix bundle copper-binding protein [Niallia sp. FSL W8-0635]|nr:four-helix bundle copper-binding protein [Yersinia enterocolitica]
MIRMENVSPTNISPAGMKDGMSMGMMHPSNLLHTVQQCAATCDHMITHLLHHEDIHARRYQLELLRDCADICHLTASCIARNSRMNRMLAHICEVCGNECAKFSDHHSQHCAQVCLHCARECRVFAIQA